MMSANWINLLGSKYVLAAIAGTLLISVSDFSQRVWIDSSESESISTELTLDELSGIALITKQQRDELLAQYSKYDSAARKLAEEQAAKQDDKAGGSKKVIPDIDSQHGDLLDLYTDTSQLRLKAVINERQHFALLERSEHESGQTSWLKLKQGDTFEGFTVKELKHTSVVLVRGEQVIDLLMYKKSRDKGSVDNA
ncbi:hypothetical protein [uncultured Shewanella sp.]|uniref:hypothetical protein n=1 Tax=uncultured Shewanella sp. TaxID=173975 RepID=UPI002614AEF0|nr:hypothetical protein [uncultured Shewanella sp.]